MQDRLLSLKEYFSWHLESDCLVRLAAITAVDGEQAAEKFIADNLRYDGVRRIAIQKAFGKGDYTCVEKLCLDKINASTATTTGCRNGMTCFLRFTLK